MGELLPYFLLFTAPLLGGALAFLLKDKAENYFKMFLSFSGAYLFSLIFIHLLPDVFISNSEAGVFILIGFFIQIFLEQLSHGIEHGHLHVHHHGKGYILSLILGLSIHSILDGIPLCQHELSRQSNDAIAYGISLHKIPEGFALIAILLHSGYKKSSSFIMLLIFCCIAPVSVFILNQYPGMDEKYFSVLIAIAVGSFLHVSTTVLFESESGKHKISWQKIFSILAGVGIALLSL